MTILTVIRPGQIETTFIIQQFDVFVIYERLPEDGQYRLKHVGAL
jgi:hypothetical protein